jgi:hypothetical protein
VGSGNAVAQPSAVHKTESLTFEDGLSADVNFWLSAPMLSLPDSVQTRIASFSVSFSVNRVTLVQADHFGAVDVTAAQPLAAEAGTVNHGLVPFFASLALGVEEPAFSSDVRGPYRVAVHPKSGMTWGTVASASDVDFVLTDPPPPEALRER